MEPMLSRGYLQLPHIYALMVLSTWQPCAMLMSLLVLVNLEHPPQLSARHKVLLPRTRRLPERVRRLIPL
jgi:hypothetical protein